MTVKFETPNQLARRLGWPVRRIRVLMAANQLRHVRIGSSFHIPEGAIEEFFSTHMVEPRAGEAK